MIKSTCWKAIYHPKRKSKYGNVPKGWKQSTKEYNRSLELKMLEKAWIITNLRSQISFLLQEWFVYDWKKEQKMTYKADFVYDQDGKMIVEDVKGYKTEVYKMKRKMLLFRYSYITFIET